MRTVDGWHRDGWLVPPVRHDDFDAWSELFTGYADFYEWPTSDQRRPCCWPGCKHRERTGM